MQVVLFIAGVCLVAVAGWLLLTGAGPATDGPNASARPDDAGFPVTAPDPDIPVTSADPPADPTSPVAEEPAVDPVAAPVAIEIPRIGVDADLVDIDLDEQRRLDAPADPARAGWYVRSPRPGEQGPALIAGHVDSKQGPAVFWDLYRLEAQDKIIVHLEDGSRAEFVVRKVGRWPKDELPVDEVHRKAGGVELRLVTCGGDFDRDRGSYEDNVVVFAAAEPAPLILPPSAEIAAFG